MLALLVTAALHAASLPLACPVLPLAVGDADPVAPATTELERPDRLLTAVPRDAQLVVSIADLDGLRSRASQSSWVQLARDERVWPTFERVSDMVGQAFERARGPAGKGDATLDPAAWLSAVHGDAVGFFALTEGDPRPIGGLFVEADGAAAMALIEPSLQRLTKRGWDLSTESHEGVELHLYEEPKRAGSSRPRDQFVVFECAGVVGAVISDELGHVREFAREAVDRLSGRSTIDGFAGNPWLAGVRKAAAHEHALELYVDVAGMFDVAEFMRRDDPDDAGLPQGLDADTERVLRRIGLLDMRWVYLSADVGADEALDLSLLAHLPQNSLLREASRLFGAAPVELLTLAPPEALGASAGHFDVSGLYQLVLNGMRELAPGPHAMVRAQIDGAKKQMGVDFERDLLGQLTGNFGAFSLRVPPSEGPALAASMYGGTVPDALNLGEAYFVGLKNSAAFERALGELLKGTGIQQAVQPEMFQGRWTQNLSLPQQSLVWCFADDQLVISESRTALRAALTRLGAKGSPSLMDEARYQEARERHADSACLTVTDSKAAAARVLGSVQLLLGLVQMGAMAEGVNEPWLEQVGTIPPPNPAAASRYLSGVLTTAVDVGPSFFKLHLSSR